MALFRYFALVSIYAIFFLWNKKNIFACFKLEWEDYKTIVCASFMMLRMDDDNMKNEKNPIRRKKDILFFLFSFFGF